MAAASSASAEACPRLDGLPGRDLRDGLRVAEANTRAARMKGLAKLDAHAGAARAAHPALPLGSHVHDALPARPDLARQGRQRRPHRPAVPPRRLKFCVEARSVVEANAGTADRFVTAGL